MNSERAYDATTKNQRERKTIRRNQMAQRPTVTQMSRKFKVTHLQGGSSKFYRDATKILRPPTSDLLLEFQNCVSTGSELHGLPLIQALHTGKTPTFQKNIQTFYCVFFTPQLLFCSISLQAIQMPLKTHLTELVQR